MISYYSNYLLNLKHTLINDKTQYSIAQIYFPYNFMVVPTLCVLPLYT
jgi:hypothetical protein